MHVHYIDTVDHPKLLYPVGDEMKKRERFFFKPIGGKLRLCDAFEPKTIYYIFYDV